MAIYALYGVAALLALAPIAVVLAASPRASNVIYGASLIVTLALGVIGLICLFGQAASTATLPLGLPWLGAHFRIDALAAFFVIVVNLGGAAASLFALGYGRHEHAPATRAAILSGLSRRHEPCRALRRCLQLPGVVGIHVALVLGAGGRASPGARKPAGGLRLSVDGELRHAGAAAGLRPARRREWQLCVRCHPRVALRPPRWRRWC